MHWCIKIFDREWLNASNMRGTGLKLTPQQIALLDRKHQTITNKADLAGIHR